MRNNNKKPRRGRKSPAKITIWEKKFSRKLRRHHKQFAKKVSFELNSTDVEEKDLPV